MVTNLTSPRTGKAVANQFYITTYNGAYFKSYDSVVAWVDNKGKVTLSYDWDYSNTTTKYLYQFLREFGYSELSKQKVRKMIEDKEFSYVEQIRM